MNWAVDRSGLEKITGQKLINFKKKYKELVKKLHPDLNPGIDPKLLEIFYKVIDAYKNGWTEIIDQYYEIIVLSEEFDLNEGLKNYEVEIERLRGKIEKVKAYIEDIKNSYPYIYKDIVESPQEIKNRKKDLEDLIENYKSSIEYLENRLKEIIGNVKY